MSNIATHPRFQPTHRTKRLLHLDGRLFVEGWFPCDVRDPGAVGEWIRETVAHECECEPEQVGCMESDDGELVTVSGVPVYYIC